MRTIIRTTGSRQERALLAAEPVEPLRDRAGRAGGALRGRAKVAARRWRYVALVASETVRAHVLERGDVIRVEGQDGWYIVDDAFQEGTGSPMDLDLSGAEDEFRYNWHVGPDHQVERRI